MNHIESIQSIVGKNNVISSDEKLVWSKDYTKAFTPNSMAVAFPKNTDEVAALVKYCFKNKIAVVPSGGRTGLSAGAVAYNGELVISTEKMKKVFSINKMDGLIHCEAGLVTKELQKVAADNGMFFPVDFASSGSSQIGGNVATNAGGIKVIRYGVIRNWVAGIVVVLGDGSVLRLDNTCLKNNTGYDLRQLFIGAEGTLGIITECIMRVTTPPHDLALSLFGLNKLEDVTKLFEMTREHKLNITAYEFFTEFGLLRVQEHTGLKSPFDKIYPFYALVEIEKAHDADMENLEAFIQAGFDKGIVLDGVMAQSSQQFNDFWALRENIAESLTALTICHKNDISLPLINITAFCTDLKTLVAKQYPGFEVVLFGHIGDGNLHINFTKPKEMSKDEFFKYTHGSDRVMFDLVKKYGGSVSAEHGIGMTKKEFLPYSRTPQEIELMKKIKLIFDPAGIMNPGKVLP